MKRPSLRAIGLTLIPFVAMCFTVPLWDRIYPRVFGLPFNLFWLMLWILLSVLCYWAAYRIEVPPGTVRPNPPTKGGAR
jgi:hypothetical protein